ncbi:hypothetical protein Kpol_1030p29 [Vanderwaltozyma polyspora DSM 70294]|uniref:E3 ubiquitin-protein ligase PEP5 n=1 Tax=Vanderwaltozyma polyspora (strain ATCC 22028 / DSM 70294 / BCRC 21397 / CBS 2163 / NBRC 10782 / NRRL Y-8283 / UCD 57-17) TaxID=436907 RepID=A7TMU7_VANPO|nr:uncharacterized protein Kpol_1030p29 [Vanderwaltozyma polyspora DSM 70294]EDO16419.1 hypothetical protein Kpol_1030p29 [Vanderwaltozyma polyspora DSM 70294]
MSLSSWRSFQFFENLPIRDPLTGTDTPLYSDQTLSAVAPLDRDKLVIGIQSNIVKVIGIRHSENLHEFKVFDSEHHITYLKVIDSFLLVVGECSGLPAQLKIYKLENILNHKYSSYHSLIEVKNGNNAHPISVISVSSDLNCIAVGFTDGRILLIRGDIARDRGSRQRVIYEDSLKEPITSIFLNSDTTFCYASTTSKVMLFNTSGRNNGNPDLLLNSKEGVDLYCSYYSKYSNEFICCFKDSIEFYKETGEKHSLVINEPSIKRVFPINENNLMIVTEAESSKTTTLEISGYIKPSTMKVMILDLTDKILSFTLYIQSTIIEVFKVPKVSSIFLLTSDGILHKITKKSINEQVEILVQKEMFEFALQLAKENHLSPLSLQHIHRQYGDFLFNKKRLNEATEQYIQCLDVVEMSSIISKYGVEESSNSLSLTNLSEYLWSLIKAGKAKPDYITLLLIVLIKLKNIDEIEDFIENFSREGIYSKDINVQNIDDETYFYSDKVLFDIDLIISLLEDSKFSNQAYKLAQKFTKDPVKIADILLNTLKDPFTTLEYTKSLSIDDTLRVLVVFSKDLLRLLPNDTNALLIDVFTGKFKRTNTFEDKVTSEPQQRDVSEVSKVFYSYTSFLGYRSNTNENTPKQKMEVGRSTYHPPKPSLIFNSFISRPFEFVVFLEACLDTYQRYGGLDDDKQILLTTLYDLYLSLARQDAEERRELWKEKAKNILNESMKLTNVSESQSRSSHNIGQPIDNSLMMLISHMNNIDIFELDKNNSTGTEVMEQFNSLILSGSPISCLEFVKNNGKNNEELCRKALSYFVSSSLILEDIGGEEVLKKEILDHVTENELIPLLDLIQILSKTNVASYGLVQNLLLDYITEEENETSRNIKLIASYEKELEEKKEKLNSLIKSNDPQHIKIKNVNCCMCEAGLELPIVVFKCTHNYHQRCLNEEDKKTDGSIVYKCPKCIVDLESSERLAKSQQEVKNNIKLVKMALNQGQEDSFKVVTDFIGRGGLEDKKVIIP